RPHRRRGLERRASDCDNQYDQQDNNGDHRQHDGDDHARLRSQDGPDLDQCLLRKLTRGMIGGLLRGLFQQGWLVLLGVHRLILSRPRSAAWGEAMHGVRSGSFSVLIITTPEWPRCIAWNRVAAATMLMLGSANLLRAQMLNGRRART